MTEEPSGVQPTFVLTPSVVSWGIEQLLDSKVHTFFPAYLEIRRAAVSAGKPTEQVFPSWSNLERYFGLPGGPPSKPNFRPFGQGSLKEGQGWMNENIAGSYAPSSIRKVPLTVVEIEGSGYRLRTGHAQLALDNLLYGQRLDVLPLAAFYYRDYGFFTDGTSLHPAGLIEVFKKDFGFATNAVTPDFDTIFSSAIPERDDWFEPWTTPESEPESEASG